MTSPILCECETLLNEVINLAGKQESSKGTIALNVADVYEKITEAKGWIKKAKLKAKRTFRLNRAALDDFYTGSIVNNSVSSVMATMIKLIELNKKYNAELSANFGGESFAAEGERLLNELRAISSSKERTKKIMPESSQELYHKQGILYYKIKDINDMGREIFISDRVKSSQYNMDILNRGGSRKKAVIEQAF